MVETVDLAGRINITLYPSVWESRQKNLLSELIKIQSRLLINIIYENLPSLKNQFELLKNYFNDKGERFDRAATMLEGYEKKLLALLEENPNCREEVFLNQIETQAFAPSDDFVLGVNLLPGFEMGKNGDRAMSSMPFPEDPYLLQCPAVRGEIGIITIRQDGFMTPCCNEGNFKCPQSLATC